MTKHILFLFLVLSFSSCRKLVEVDTPSTRLDGSNVYSSDATAAAVLTGIYHKMSVGGLATGLNSISLKAGLSADEFDLYSNADNALVQHYTNSLNSTNSTFWDELYNYVYAANAAIRGLSESTKLTPAAKRQLTGEAKFIRAFSYFYLVNFFGDVPLILGTDYRVNAVEPRAATSDVYRQMISDLRDAQDLLSDEYIDNDAISASTDRVRPNRWAATALLARVYLYNNDWPHAESEASGVIENSLLYDTVDINISSSNAFEKNSKEALWQLMPVNSGRNTEDAPVFIITSFGPGFGNPVFLRNALLTEFETNDLRKSNWIGSTVIGSDTFYFPYKYKVGDYGQPVTEYLMVLRLAEQYLVRAEARAQQDKIAEAQSDINVLRMRARLPNTTANTKSLLLEAILHERRTEFFSEWGHRWLDLKRTGQIDEVMSIVTPEKGGSWNTNWQLYPLPLADLRADPNLIQNNDY